MKEHVVDKTIIVEGLTLYKIDGRWYHEFASFDTVEGAKEFTLDWYRHVNNGVAVRDQVRWVDKMILVNIRCRATTLLALEDFYRDHP